MLKSFQKFIAVTAAFMAVMAYGMPTQAALMTSASVRLSNAAAGQGADYVFSAVATSGGEIKGIRMAWRTSPSTGAGTADQVLADSAIGSTDWTGIAAHTAWALNKTNVDTGILYLQNPDQASVPAGTVIGWRINSITNPSIGTPPNGCTANANNSSGTCFIRIQTYNTDALATMQAQTPANIIDEVTIAFAVNAAVTVTAKVDPSLTFTVNGVNTTTAANGVLTSADSTFNTLPFGFLTPGTPRYLAHDLTVRTNANNGYIVTVRMATQMTGTYGTNNIDPFAAPSTTWSTPQNWAVPTGTVANVDSGWIGAHTTNTNVAGWAEAAGKWGPVNATANQVMNSSTPDQGSAATRVTYALEVNVFQPADSYTGVIVYNCTPTY
jgi:hypothetical protein